MSTLDLIYVTTGRHPEVEKAICEVTDSVYAHAAVGITIEGEYKIVEATGEGVKIKDGNLYDGCKTLQIIKLPIAEEQRRAVALKAISMAGMQYGKDDCVVSAIRDRWGLRAAEFVACIIDNPQTIQCSGLQVDLTRAAYQDFAGTDPAPFYTPEHARQHAVEYAGILGVAV